MLTFNETLRLTSFVPNLSRLIAQLLCYRGSCRKSATNFTNKNSECRKKTFSKKVSRLPSRFDKTTKNFSNINIKTLLTFTNIFFSFLFNIFNQNLFAHRSGTFSPTRLSFLPSATHNNHTTNQRPSNRHHQTSPVSLILPTHAMHRKTFYIHALRSMLSRCGGSLVSRRHVVTAGHCVARATPRQVHVTLGDYSKPRTRLSRN